LVFSQDTGTEGNDLARKVVDGKDHASAKAVVLPAAFFGDHQSSLFQHFTTEPLRQRKVAEMVPGLEAVPQFKFADDRVAETPLPEIAQGNSAAFFVIEQQVGVRLARKAHEDVQAIALIPSVVLGRCCRLLLDLDPILLREVPNGFDVAEALVLHNKSDGVTTFSAAEIFKNTLGGNDVK